MASLIEYLEWRSVPEEAVKLAYSDAVRSTGEFLGYLPGKALGMIPNTPTPLKAMLASGIVGAGLGYGAGYAGEHMLPNNWQRGKLRKTMALIGALTGAAPAMAWGLGNKLNGADFNDDSFLNTPKVENNYDWPPAPVSEDYRIGDVLWPSKIKTAESLTGLDLTKTLIDTQELERTIWGDPRVAPRLPNNVQAATSGLMAAAREVSSSPRFVTPADMAHVTAGMGVGWLSGAIVGKALGVLTGLPSSAQETLKQTGMWAGAIRTIIPTAFGG